MSPSSCVICRLLTGDLPATFIAREANAAAWFPLVQDSLAPGHTVVACSVHVVGIHDVAPSDLAAVMDLTQRLARAMRSQLGATGVNLLNASGPGSEQSVAHLHIHVVPRWHDDALTTWPAGHSVHHVASDPAAALTDALRDGSGPSPERNT